MSFKDFLVRLFNKKKGEEKSVSIDENWSFVTALVAIILSSVLVNLWIRVINNFTTHTLGLNPDSTGWALLAAIFFTAVLIVYIIFILDEDTSKAVKQNMTGISIIGSVPIMSAGIIDAGFD